MASLARTWISENCFDFDFAACRVRTASLDQRLTSFAVALTMRSSDDHWKRTTQDCDKNPKNKGVFRFAKVPGGPRMEAAAAAHGPAEGR